MFLRHLPYLRMPAPVPPSEQSERIPVAWPDSGALFVGVPNAAFPGGFQWVSPPAPGSPVHESGRAGSQSKGRPSPAQSDAASYSGGSSPERRDPVRGEFVVRLPGLTRRRAAAAAVHDG